MGTLRLTGLGQVPINRQLDICLFHGNCKVLVALNVPPPCMLGEYQRPVPCLWRFYLATSINRMLWTLELVCVVELSQLGNRRILNNGWLPSIQYNIRLEYGVEEPLNIVKS